MSAFSAEWLALREPADVQARSSRLTRLVADRLAQNAELQALDLATGTGANIRDLIEYLPPRQSWLLVDHDSALLDDVPRRMHKWAAARGYETAPHADGVVVRGERLTCKLAMRRVDLAADIDGGNPGIVAGRALVTCAALLDLVSDRWLRTLARRCGDAGATILFALSYDGRMACLPEEPEDDRVRNLVNRHQRLDKGFGAALGPEASEYAERCFTGFGYEVHRDSSDWVLSPEAHELQRELIAGWAEAAMAIRPEESASIRSWRTRRLAHVAANRSRIVVGHQDLAAWPR